VVVLKHDDLLLVDELATEELRSQMKSVS
jgi:hypothetical protein